MLVKCNSCSNVQFCSAYIWNCGKVRCVCCGGSVDKTEKPKKELDKISLENGIEVNSEPS